VPVACNIDPSEAQSCAVRRVDDPVEGHLEIVDVDPSMFLPGSVLIVRSQLTDDARGGLQVMNAQRLGFGTIYIGVRQHCWVKPACYDIMESSKLTYPLF
jgi:hypothetical protein